MRAERPRPGRSAVPAVAFAVGLAIAAWTGSSANGPPAAGGPEQSGRVPGARPAQGPLPIVLPVGVSGSSASEDPYERARNVDADARDPTLRAEHLRLLARRPLLQRLPYRDPRIGVALVGGSGGELVLRVAYVGIRSAARADYDRLLARLHDSGGGYTLRFQAVGR